MQALSQSDHFSVYQPYSRYSFVAGTAPGAIYSRKGVGEGEGEGAHIVHDEAVDGVVLVSHLCHIRLDHLHALVPPVRTKPSTKGGAAQWLLERCSSLLRVWYVATNTGYVAMNTGYVAMNRGELWLGVATHAPPRPASAPLHVATYPVARTHQYVAMNAIA